jgi:hypothetical protein
MIRMELTAGVSLDSLLHPAYQAQARARAFWRLSDQLLLDDGSRYVDGVDARGRKIIPQHDREQDIDWLLRKDLTHVEGYIRQIADHYCSHVLRHAPVLTDAEHPAYRALVADADGWGTSLDALLAAALRVAFVERQSYLLADSTLTAPAASAADGGRYVLRRVDPDAVLWWQDSPSGQPLSALLALADTAGRPFLLLVGPKTIQRADYDPNSRLILIVSTPVQHRFGGCPLVRIAAPPIIPPVAEAQKRLAWLASLLAMEETDATITQLVITGAQPSATKDMLRSSRTAWVFEDPAAKAETFGADPAQAESLRKSIADTRDALYRSAKVQPVQAQGAPESGVAHAYRFVDADAELAALADALELARNRATAIWATAAGVSPPPVAQYPDSFAPVDDRAVLDRLLAVEGSSLPPAWRSAERRRAAALLHPEDEDVAATAEDLGEGDDGAT